MKVNAKYFNLINTTPKEVQKTENGTIEIYSLNEYATLYNSHVSKGKFHVWSNAGGENYKLLIEDNYYEIMKDLYTSDVNQVWLNFYDEITLAKKNTMLKVFLPVSIIIFLVLIAVSIFLPTELESLRTGISISMLVIVMFLSLRMNKKVSAEFTVKRDAAIDEINSLVGEERFEELLNSQEAFTKKFYKDQYEAIYGEDPDYDVDLDTETNNNIEENTEVNVENIELKEENTDLTEEN